MLDSRALANIRKYTEEVLTRNDRGQWTIPAQGIYPHQWLWDSCFISIGLRHIDADRAATELRSLLRGQWANGMFPNMIFTAERRRLQDANLWHSERVEGTPKEVRTTGITQPPLVAEATARVAERLDKDKRLIFLKEMVPAIIRYHEWLYRERDPRNEGLVLLIHPWETGMDNSPSWMEELKGVHTPPWIRIVNLLHIDWLLTHLRRDTKQIPADQRMSTAHALRLYHAQQDLRRHDYDIDKVLSNPHRHFIVESLSYNCMLIRNNSILLDLAKQANIVVPNWLQERFGQAIASLTTLCNPTTGVCYHRDFDTNQIEEVPTISILMPLYSGAISKQQATQIVGFLTNERLYWPAYPVPTVPVNSETFSEKRYWQGPTWLNTNWLIVDGLRRYGFDAEADMIREKSLELVAVNNCREYFSPLTGEGYGAQDFSWTAAVALDFLKQL